MTASGHHYVLLFLRTYLHPLQNKKKAMSRPSLQYNRLTCKTSIT